MPTIPPPKKTPRRGLLLRAHGGWRHFTYPYAGAHIVTSQIKINTNNANLLPLGGCNKPSYFDPLFKKLPNGEKIIQKWLYD